MPGAILLSLLFTLLFECVLGCMSQPLDDGAAFYHSGQSFVPQASKVEDDSWTLPRRHRRRCISLSRWAPGRLEVVSP